MALTVASVFARHGADPWQEAGRLATLSRTDAADCLAGMIANMPKSPWPPPEAGVIATRLIGLLPKSHVTKIEQATRRMPARQTLALLAGVALAAAAAVFSFF